MTYIIFYGSTLVYRNNRFFLHTNSYISNGLCIFRAWATGAGMCLLPCFFYSSCSSLYTCHGRKEETVLKNQNVLSVVNMSFLLVTFMLNLAVTCLGEVRF